jgi:MFS family permease
LINGLAKNAGMFIAGRCLIGGAGPFGKITAVALLQEIAHPRLRAILASSFYCNYYIGSTAAAWFCYGSLFWGDTTWSWRAPCLFQIMAPLIVLVALFFIPESPRVSFSMPVGVLRTNVYSGWYIMDEPKKLWTSWPDTMRMVIATMT